MQAKEEQFFDEIADKSLVEFEQLSNWDIYALELLGNISGKQILEIGCGTGRLTLELCKRGGQVVAVDISNSAIEIAENRIRRAGWITKVKFINKAFEETTFTQGEFDYVFGKWILHHLDFKLACNKIFWTLKSNGRAVFIETSYLNPITKFIRKHFVGKFGIRRLGTINEKPLTADEIFYAQQLFNRINLHFPEFSFFWLFDRHILDYKKLRRLAKFLNDIDHAISHHLPKLNKYGYYLIIECIK
ncbi:MAG: class I SAM-dependent methyltransferase [candidate division WOR-3 bacterium]